MKKLSIPSAIVGLAFGVMAVVTMSNYFDPIENAYANGCPSASTIEAIVQDVVDSELNSCQIISSWLYC